MKDQVQAVLTELDNMREHSVNVKDKIYLFRSAAQLTLTLDAPVDKKSVQHLHKALSDYVRSMKPLADALEKVINEPS